MTHSSEQVSICELVLHECYPKPSFSFRETQNTSLSVNIHRQNIFMVKQLAILDIIKFRMFQLAVTCDHASTALVVKTLSVFFKMPFWDSNFQIVQLMLGLTLAQIKIKLINESWFQSWFQQHCFVQAPILVLYSFTSILYYVWSCHLCLVKKKSTKHLL